MRNDAKDARIDRTLCCKSGRRRASEWNAALYANGGVSTTNLGGLQRDNGISEVRANRPSGADLQRLIAGVELRNGEVSLEFSRILQRSLHRGVKLGLALESFGHAAGVCGQQYIKRNRASVDGRVGLIVAG